jgi:hypothetical protein
MKRGQVAAFFIIALLVIITVSIIAYLQWDYIEGNWLSRLGFYDSVPQEVQPIHDQIMQGFEDTSLIIIPENAWQSGYYKLGDNVNPYGTTYYIYKSQTMMPSKEFIEDQLALAMDENIPLYINYDSISSDFVVIPQEVPKTKVIIEDEAIIFETNYPHSITKGNQTFNLENFKYVAEIRYGELLDVLKESVDMQSDRMEGICMDCLLDLNQEYGVTFEVFKPADHETEVVMFADDTVIDGRTLQFMYAVRYAQ